MKILAVIFHFPPISGGGVIVAVEIINNLAKLGHKITVITPELKWDGPTYDPKMESNVEIIRVKVPSSDKIKIAARRCRNYLKEEAEKAGKQSNYDFIFTIFHPFHMAPHAAVDCGKNLGLPVIVKIDDAMYQKSRGLKSIQRMIEKIYNSRALNKASTVLVSNEDTKNTVNEFYKVDKNKIKIIPNGVNISKFKHIQTNSKKVIFSGVMYHHRGLDVLIEAAPLVIKEIPDIEIELYGEGPELVKLRESVKEKNLGSNIKFMGWISNEQIPDVLSEASIGLGPLRKTEVTDNALPIKVLEYMASSLPIIAASGTLPKDVLVDGENGYFVKNHTELASKIIEILSSTDKQNAMGKKSLEIVTNFDWKIIIEKILKLL